MRELRSVVFCCIQALQADPEISLEQLSENPQFLISAYFRACIPFFQVFSNSHQAFIYAASAFCYFAERSGS